MKIKLLLLSLLFFPVLVFAALPHWDIVPAESKIIFTGTQNNSPISGEFKKFSGEIKGDLDQLPQSSVTITIDTNSLAVSYKELEDALKTTDWFNPAAFPKATFTADQFKKIGGNTYRAIGKLTILDVTIPLKITLILESYTKTKARVSGETTIKRSSFGIGKGEWASTDEIKDDVKINFVITAVKK